MKPPRVPGLFNLSDLLADELRPKLLDTAQRNVFLHGALESEHTTLAVADEARAETDGMPQRIRSVEVAGVSGGTVTVQVTVNGRDIFDDTVRPVSDAGPAEATDIYVFPAGSDVKTIIEATSGTPTGTASVVITTEPYILLGKFQPVVLRGKARMFSSRRREARILNTVSAPSGTEMVSRLYAYSLGGQSGLVAESSTATGDLARVRDVVDLRPREGPRTQNDPR